MMRMSTTGDCNNNTGHDSCERYGINEYIDDNNRRPAHVSVLGIKLGFAGHMTRSRLLIGLLASVCLTFCSLLTRCMPVTTWGDCTKDCRTEVKVEVMGQLRRLATVKNYGDDHPIEKTQQSDIDSSYDSRRHFDPEPLQRLPQCLIIGVRKAGTRALLEFLSLHPDIRIQKQELHFFDDDQTYSLGLDWYRRRMPYTSSGQLTIEKTPGYFVGEDVPQRVRAMNVSVKLLVIVRDPVERAISDYAQLHAARLRRGKYHARFEDLAIDPLTGQVDGSYRAVRRSIYCLDMARWLTAFDARQFHFVSGEQLVINPVNELRRVETFLGLEHRINESMFYFNESRGFYCIRSPPIAVAVGGANFTTVSGRPVVASGRTSNFSREASASIIEDGTITGVDNRVTPNSPDRCLASSKGRVHPNISRRVIQKLRKFFRSYNELFYKQTGIDFGWPTT